MENITDGSLKNVSDTNAVVKGLEKSKVDCKTLEEFFTSNVGSVKCCKVSKTIENSGDAYSCKSNGYGFVNFETKELLEKAIEECNGRMLEGSRISIEKYNKELRKEPKFNNLYVRGFTENLTDDDLTALFSKFGELGSVKVMRNEDGSSKKFGFVCYKEAEDAQKAVDEMHTKAIEDGSTLYVAKLEKKGSRWASLKKSLAKSNLYVRNFDKNVTEDDLKKFFGGDSLVRNVRIMTTDVQREDGVHKESKQFGFVSFINPKDANDVVIRYNNEELEFNNKQLYVNFYEDKAARKKRLSNKKDNLMGLLDPSVIGQTGGDQATIMEYFMQMFQQYFKNFQGGNYGGYNNYNNYGQHYTGGYNQNSYQNRRGGGRPHRGNYPQSSSYGYQNQPAMYGRPPRQDAHHSYANAAATIPHSVPPAAPTHMISQMPPAPVPVPIQTQPRPPISSATSAYSQTIKSIVSTPDFISLPEESRREKIGEEIYNYVLQKAGEESAPKITGMIIDLPYQDLIVSIQSWEGLQEKIQEGLDLLKDDQ